jgi:hypothetical protein
MQFDRASALATQRIRLVQNRRDPPLLIERREWNAMLEKLLSIDVFHCRAMSKSFHFVNRRTDGLTKIVEINFLDIGNNLENVLVHNRLWALPLENAQTG